jgi:hypothetical protein
MTSLYLPLVVPSIVSAGDLAIVPLSKPRPATVPRETPTPVESMPEVWEAPEHEMTGADGVPLGAGSIEVDGANPRAGDDVGGSLWDLVMPSADIDVTGSAIPSDVTLAPGPSGATSLGVSGLLLLGSPNFPPPPIDWRRVEEDVEFTCSQVTVVERLLHETLALVR